MTQAIALAGAVLIAGAAVCASGAAPAAETRWGLIGSGCCPFGADGNFADAAGPGDRFRTPVLVSRIPGIDEGAVGGSVADDVNGSENKHPAPLASIDFASGSAGSADGESSEPAAGSADDITRMLSPPQDFEILPTAVLAAVIEDLPTAPAEADEAVPSEVVASDILFEDAVPALSALGLLSASFLLLGFVRRYRRAALARRIKRSFPQRVRPLRR